MVHLHAIGNIHMRYILLGPVPQSEASPAVHQGFVSSIATQPKSIISWRLVIKTDNRSFATFRWFKKGSCQFQVKVCAKNTVLYPYSTQGRNPTNRHKLTNIWIRGWNVFSSRRSYLNHTVRSQFLQFVGLLGIRIKTFELFKTWPRIPRFEKSCLIRNKFLIHS